MLALALLLLWSVLIGCPIYRIFGVSCPGCGMSRAIFSMLKLDFVSAYRYHPLFLLFTLATLYVVFRGAIQNRVKISDKAEFTMGLISLGLLLIVWFYRRF